MSGNTVARRQLAVLADRHGAEPRVGCSLVSHRDLGFCGGCARATGADELIAWQLLAMAERGIPPQAWEGERRG